MAFSRVRKSNTALLFEKDYLNNLVEDESSCVKIQEQNYHLALHPFHLNNINESLKDILNQSIGKYDKKLNGILLGYQNIKLISPSGAVANDSFFIHIDIAASFFLFTPEVGKILTGTVNKKSKDHVACLVHKTFNVSLPKPENTDEDDEWMGEKVKIGQDILFRIIFVNLEGRLPYIKSEFVAILGEQDSGISTSEENVEKKINKKIIFDNNSEDEQIDISKKKKKKKRKKEEDSEDEGNEKKKRKTNKHKLDEEEHLVDAVDGIKKKKSKHKDLSGVTELDESLNYKKKKNKHKKHSYDVEEEIEEDIVKGNEDYSHNENKDENLTSEKAIKKKKRKKHQNDSATEEQVIDLNLDQKSKKKKKSKHNESLENLTDAVLQRTLLNLSENQTTNNEDQTKRHKKKRKSKDLNQSNISDDLSSLLPDLNLSQIFSESVSSKSPVKNNFQMADNEDKISKKKHNSISHGNFWENQTELLADSDLEKIIKDVDKTNKDKKEGGDKDSKKLKRKRRRSNSSDDFVTPILHKKHKKN